MPADSAAAAAAGEGALPPRAVPCARAGDVVLLQMNEGEKLTFTWARPGQQLRVGKRHRVDAGVFVGAPFGAKFRLVMGQVRAQAEAACCGERGPFKIGLRGPRKGGAALAEGRWRGKRCVLYSSSGLPAQSVSCCTSPRRLGLRAS